MNIILFVSNQNRQVTVKIKAKSKGEISPQLIQKIPALVFLTMMEEPLASSEEFGQAQERSRIGFSLGEGDEEERDNH